MFCKNCGKELQEDWLKCPYCGETLEKVKEERRVESVDKIKLKKPFYKKWWFWVGIVVVGFLILTLLGDNGSDNKETSEKVDISKMDMEDFLDKSEEEIKQLGFEKNEDYTYDYGTLDGAVQIGFVDEKVGMILIEKSEKETPSFHGVKIGMSQGEAYNMLIKEYPEDTEKETTEEYEKMLINFEANDSITIQATEGKVRRIIYTSLEVMGIDEESYRKAKEEVLKAERAEYIFPDSDKKYLSEDEVRSVEAEKLFIGRNEIFARHGYIFNDDELNQYFQSTSWYQGTITSDGFSDAVFNDFEKKNVELIKKIEKEISGLAEPFIGIEGEYSCGSDIDAGVVTVLMVDDTTVYMNIGTWAATDMLRKIEATIVDSNTAVWEGVTFKWIDTAAMQITGVTGDLSEILTDNVEYLIAEYYHAS